MASKRMFTMKICDSDAFLDMPLSAQCLYFHLNMRADDDGFVGNSKRIARLIGANEDDLKLLLAKRFLLAFEDGVIVIKHWRMHNTLSRDRYHETQYLEEKSQLKLKDNGSYTFGEGALLDDSKKIAAADRQTDNRRTLDAHETDADLDIDKDIDKDKELGKEEGKGKDKGKKRKTVASILEAHTSLFSSIRNNYMFNDDVADKAMEFLTYKAERKEEYTELGLKALLKKIEKAVDKHGSFDVCDCIDDTLANGWKGLFFDRLDKEQKSSKKANDDNYFDRWANA